jgi:hypothetical protein
MDINFTGQLWGMPASLIGQATLASGISSIPTNLTIVNQIAATNTWVIAAIGALGAIFGALAGGFATYYIEKLKIKNMDAQRMQQAYSELMGRKEEAYSLLLGRKHTMLQFYASYYSLYIKSQSWLYHGKLLAFNNIDIESDELVRVIEHRKTGNLIQEDLDKAILYIREKFYSEVDTSPDVKEGLRTRQKSEDLQLELGRSAERVFEILGKIKILFPSQEVRDHVEQIEKALDNLSNIEGQINQDTNTFNETLEDAINSTTSIEVSSINSNKKLLEWTAREDSELKKWAKKMFDELKIRIEDVLDPEIKKLLEHLEAEIKKEQANLVGEYIRHNHKI